METQKIFEFFGKDAAVCPKCGEKLEILAVKLGFDDEIVATYGCINPECQAKKNGLRSFRRLLPAAVVKIKEAGILSEEDLAFAERQRRAALGAEIRCPMCGHREEHKESFFGRNGKLLHRFGCRNERCFGQDIVIELKEEDCERIEERARKKGKCRICGELHGAKVKCDMQGGYICEKHCAGCKWKDESTSLTHCNYFRKVKFVEAAKKGIEETEKALLEHFEI